MSSSELERERDYVHGLYRRLDALRDAAQEQLESVRRSAPGGTHQNRSERDAFARIYEDRIGQLREIDERLAFGRLELEVETDTEAGTETDAESESAVERPVRYIGRIGLRDEDQRSLLLDWRVPQARAFYQATAATPLGARARRHLQSKGRDIVRIDDEIFDAELLETDAASLQGEAALMASLTAERTGRMGDIVATIQAEQDAIIRSELRGALVVQGGPGTGKTAVALHRAAFLLYSHRERLSASGVLIVGPSRAFLRYIEAVLPSLGETGVVLASLGQLFPGEDARHDDVAAVAQLKGSLEMAALIKRAVRSRRVVPTETQRLEINGEILDVPAELLRSAMQKAWDSHKPHNLARVIFNKAAIAGISRLLANQLRAHGNTIDDADQKWLREDIRTAHDVKVALNTAWMPLTPQKLVDDLYARPGWLQSLTPHWTPEQRELLRRERDVPFTISDVALLDEAAELLGEVDVAQTAAEHERKQQRKRDVENATAAIRNMGVDGMIDAETLAEGFEASVERSTTAELASADRSWTYGHIVVDEAQELSPMQWKLLARRNPLKSFTIVGDVAQASAAAATSSWGAALSADIGDHWRLEELTVNYRTPSQIVAVAEAVAVAHNVSITPSRAVRHSEWPVAVTVSTPEQLAASVSAVVTADRAISHDGTIAVIVSDSLTATIVDALQQSFAGEVGEGAAGLNRPIAVLTPQESKGLEFDSVIVVEPQRIVEEISRGAAALYVAMTRPTQRLAIVAAEGLPEGIPQPS
ncbi:AAA family ATPase [Salinibacterium sp. NSLL150]|uniref:HelD family protein n=1 Tax=unclassified Salinibacterium TaxID=2632331 RepID=UPI0018CFEBC3|nr:MULTISPECIES: UvrD-helicase domain-containing protein [unclassified Salinibacterium]MBH0100116.1 AAA family ATPase [Salinibacterium sp. NSLL35]MBH0102870.1 AAA family ATPase [Salinibacterium sp. NSLL150]MBH0105630.1 AAA family ATPase [Salinibacterium sp. NSLL16]MBH0108390.1 AAA family ATPase [Salinibacterium sp. NSLL17]MBH0111168.1 AAA family ATPase [Salinibacterium sp. NG22]